MSKQAIILAAGQGRRLWPFTKERPKCLLDIGGKSIIEHQVDMLVSCGIERIAVVTGYMGAKVREVLGGRVEYFENSLFASTSSMYSLWLAQAAAADGFLVINSDVLFHAGILRSLLESPHADALAVDLESVLLEEEMKVQVRHGRVAALSKQLADADGENVGMIKFSAEGSRVLFAKIDELLRQNHRQVMVPFAVNAIAPTYPLMVVPVQGYPWIEIDFPEDYERARHIVYPAILRTPSK
jgi:L-glutamine-phosphate cytidylyltransferase